MIGQDQVERVRALAGAYKSDREIAEILGVKRWHISDLRAALGIESGTRLARRHGVSIGGRREEKIDYTGCQRRWEEKAAGVWYGGVAR